MWSRVVNVVSVLFVVPRFMLSTGSHHCPLHLHSPSCISHRPFRIIADSRLPSHNPAASASFDALILLRKAQLYNRTTNPRPVEFTLDVVQPPQGMTNQQQMAIQTILQQQMLDKMRAKGGEVPSDPSKIPRAKMEPPLVVSWMTNEVASGSIADVEAIISRMREQQWASKDAKEETPGVITDAVRRFKSWWSFYDR